MLIMHLTTVCIHLNLQLQKLTWSADPTLATAMANFRDTKITPQIFAEVHIP
jgi:hypothetical protein